MDVGAFRGVDLTDRHFGKLKVLWKYKESINGGCSWVCRCECGHIEIITGYELMSGRKKRCAYCHRGVFSYSEDYKSMKCSLPNGSGFWFDTEDFHLVSQYSWSQTKTGYYKASLGSREKDHILLHRLLLDAPKDKVVDHIDGDKNNNRRSNLRICTVAQNVRNAGIKRNNQSGFKGVSYDKRRGNWTARIFNGRLIHLGSFTSAEEAAKAYDDAAKKLHGEFAKTNAMIKAAGGTT